MNRKNYIHIKLPNLTDDQINLIPEDVLVSLEKKPWTYKFFLSKYWSGWDWDIKQPNQDYWKINNKYEHITFLWREFDYDKYGNIAYWFVAAALWIPLKTIQVMAWMAQINEETSNPNRTREWSYFDDPWDQLAMKIWYNLYEQALSEVKNLSSMSMDTINSYVKKQYWATNFYNKNTEWQK